MLHLFPQLLSVSLIILNIAVTCSATAATCRSYCGNLTVDYPFGLLPGCGYGGLRELLFCVNDVLMLHISSGSYRVLDIDYAFRALTLFDAGMSTCDRIAAGGKGNGFVVEPWRAPYLAPTADNLFLLLGCRPDSPLFQGFPGKHLPCRNVSGMSCDDYLDCPAWAAWPPSGGAAPRCCGVPFEAIRAINLSRLECAAYSSAYSVAPLRVAGAADWLYGIRVGYAVPAEFCQACEASGGTCGHDDVAFRDLCLCDGWNSTSTCATGGSVALRNKHPVMETLALLLIAAML